MRDGYRILDFRNRPPLPAYASLFALKRTMLGNPVRRTAMECWFRWLTKSILPLRNAGAAITTASMRANDPAEAMRLWWDEIDAAGIDAVVCNGRLSDDRGSIDGASLAQLQDRYPQRFIGLAPADLEVAPGETVAQCEHAVRALGLRGINIEALQDQFLFGTSYPFSSMREPVRATLRLPLPPAVMEKYLWGNGARLLKLAAGT